MYKGKKIKLHYEQSMLWIVDVIKGVWVQTPLKLFETSFWNESQVVLFWWVFYGICFTLSTYVVLLWVDYTEVWCLKSRLPVFTTPKLLLKLSHEDTLVFPLRLSSYFLWCRLYMHSHVFSTHVGAELRKAAVNDFCLSQMVLCMKACCTAAVAT